MQHKEIKQELFFLRSTRSDLELTIKVSGGVGPQLDHDLELSTMGGKSWRRCRLEVGSVGVPEDGH